MRRFHVIDGTPPPDTPRQRVVDRLKRAPKPATMIQCLRCGSRETVETRTGVMLRDGKPVGGTKALLCACCWTKGERVVLL